MCSNGVLSVMTMHCLLVARVGDILAPSYGLDELFNISAFYGLSGENNLKSDHTLHL